MLSIDDMKKIKNQFGLTYADIAKQSKVPLGTVQKIMGGITIAPRRPTLQALSDFFTEYWTRNTEQSFSHFWTLAPEFTALSRQTPALMLADSAAAKEVSAFSDLSQATSLLSAAETDVNQIDPQFRHLDPALGRLLSGKGHTLEDYYALPDDIRVELIDGVFFLMEAPASVHQALILRLSNILTDFVDSKGGDCVVFFAPLDVQLDMDDRTMLEPDILVICDRDKIRRKNIYGAPDLVIEIASPSTKSRDNRIKLSKYANAGVREYWTVDPDKQQVVVYHFEMGDPPMIYGFDTEVPVGIWNGELKVDFAAIRQKLAFLLDMD